MPLRNLTRRLQRFTTDPVERVHDFRRLLTLAKYPRWVRRIVLSLALNSPRHKRNHFGTFSVSVYSGLGAESLHPIAPVTSVLNYGVIGTGGMVFVRVIYDHRVLDGATIARALARLEAVLAEQIVPELHSLKATEQPRGWMRIQIVRSFLKRPHGSSSVSALQVLHFGHCSPNPVDDESDFRHRTRLGFDGVELTCSAHERI